MFSIGVVSSIVRLDSNDTDSYNHCISSCNSNSGNIYKYDNGEEGMERDEFISSNLWVK